MRILLVLGLIALVSASLMDRPAIRKEMIDEINNMQTTWTAGVNKKFEGMTIAEAKRLMGVQFEKLPESPVVALEDIPENFDSRKQWPNCPSMGLIRDQASCGSCWAFGAAESWSDRVCVGSEGKITDPMSTQDLLACCGYSCGSGCNGGYLSGAWGYIKSTGLVSGGLYGDNKWCYPYSIEPCNHHVNGTYPPCHDEPTPSCKKQCVNGRNWENDKHKASRVYSITGEAKMQTELMTNGPFEVALTVYEDFLTYKSGVYRHKTGSYLGGHAVRCVGWGVEDGAKYWLIANSWNEQWGDNGYFKILRGTNECSIESQGYGGVL